VSTYRVAAVVVAEPEVPWAARPKAAFARGASLYARRNLYPLVTALFALALGLVLALLGHFAIGCGIGAAAFLLTLTRSRMNEEHDPTPAVHAHAQDDLVAWGERVAEAEGPRMIGSAIAGVLFAAAAEREGACRTALEYYEAALDDVASLHPQALVKEIASIAAVRGAMMAHEIGQRERGTALLEKRTRLFERTVPDAVIHLPSLLTCKPFEELAANLDEQEKDLYASDA
jgi:hypothetical protein